MCIRKANNQPVTNGGCQMERMAFASVIPLPPPVPGGPALADFYHLSLLDHLSHNSLHGGHADIRQAGTDFLFGKGNQGVLQKRADLRMFGHGGQLTGLKALIQLFIGCHGDGSFRPKIMCKQ